MGTLLLLATMASAPAWFQQSRTLQGWELMSAGDPDAYVTLVAPGPDANSLWTRFEMREPRTPDNVSSYVRLFTVDCQARKYRVVHTTNYEGPDLTGRSRTITAGSGWYAHDSSAVGRAVYGEVCGAS